MATAAIVVVSDAATRDQLMGELRSLSMDAQTADTIEDGLELMRAPGVLFTDVCFPEGFELLESVAEDERTIPVIVGDGPALEAASRLLESGVAIFLPTPIDRGELKQLVQGLGEPFDEDRTRVRRLREIEDGRCGSMVGRSPVMKQLFEQIVRMAPSSATVLVTGESGTGKEMVAQALHELSPRSRGPFVAVNCGAISPNLMESELFGHERGSFTGATRTHRGFFERAHRGTLFLDEITEMPLDLQVKLLRVLETSQFTRIGAENTREVDVRVIAASNRPIDDAIRKGRLREDLYYRLKVLHLEIPPLRARPADVRPLAMHFLDIIGEREGRTKQLSEHAVQALESYHWPGNAREVKNAVYTAFLLSEGDEITAESLPDEVADGEGDIGAFYGSALQIPVGSSIEDAERRLILMTLAQLEGNKTRTAEVLGISVKTLYNRLHAYGAMETREKRDSR